MNTYNTYPGFTHSYHDILADLVSAAMDDPSPVIRRRANVLTELLAGLDVPLLARLHHLSPRVLEAWRDRFNAADGTDGLADASLRQLPIELPDDYREQINTLLKADPLAYGYGPRDSWSCQRLSDEMDVITGIYLGETRLHKLLIAWGYKPVKRIIDRRSPAQKKFEAYFIASYAEARLQYASREKNAALGKVTITTWRPPSHLAARRRYAARKAETEKFVSQLQARRPKQPAADDGQA